MKRTLTRLNMLAFVLAMFMVVSCNLEKSESSPRKQKGEQQETEVKGYQGDENFTTNLDDSKNYFSVSRDKATKNYTITIKNLEESTEWKIYAGTDPDNIDMSRPYMSGLGNASHVIAVPADTKYFFQVVLPDTEQGAVIAERSMPIQGGYNFRDLGGYRTSSGKYVKWGKFYRSALMSGLNEADKNYLSTIGLKTIVDLRTSGEVTSNPDRYPEGVSWVNYSVYTPYQGDFTNFFIAIVQSEYSLGLFRQIFEMMMDESQVPLLFHCTAGRDRTGTTAMLLLLALGVDEETIVQDFMLTTALHPSYPAQEKWIRAGLSTIHSTNESVESFFEEKIGVDLIKFRQMYLE